MRYSRPNPIPSITVLLILFACPLCATSVVAVRTRSAIFIGSDSKIVDGNGRDTGKVCKILASNGIFFAVARIWGSPTQEFSVASIAAEALETKGDLKRKISCFESSLVRPLERLLLSLKASDPKRFERELDGHRAVDAIFVGFDAGYPALFVRSFIVSNSAARGIRLQIKREECTRNCPDLAYVALGEHRAIDEALAANPDFWKVGVVAAVKKLINLEVLKAPNLVGLPISILSIDSSGPHWIDRGACQKMNAR